MAHNHFLIASCSSNQTNLSRQICLIQMFLQAILCILGADISPIHVVHILIGELNYKMLKSIYIKLGLTIK